MRSAIVLLKRSLSIPKHEWCERSCNRTLLTIDIEPLIKNIWRASRPDMPEQSFVELCLQADGSQKNPASIHSIQGQQKAFIGDFGFSFVSSDRVKVMLREDKCSRQLGTPRRRARQISLLRPWKPVRVLLNGRAASSSGQHYILQEYHLALCDEPMPDLLDAARFVDLQADLM